MDGMLTIKVTVESIDNDLGESREPSIRFPAG